MTQGAGRGRVLRAAGTVLALALVVGCTPDEPEPTAPPTTAAPTTAAPTPSPEPSEPVAVAPTRPEAMDRTDEAGAVAAAEYFMELFAYVFATGDLGEWREISAVGCEFCLSVDADVAAVYAGGGSFEGMTLDIAAARAVGYEESLGVHAVELEYSTAAGEELDAQGAVVSTVPAESGFLILDVLPTPEGWQLLTGDARDASVA